jgi:hypothetical protein
MVLCQKFYICKNLSMLYDSNGFNSYIYIYCFLFFKTCLCATHIYILLALRQNPLNINFWAVFEVSGTVGVVFTGHVQLRTRTCPGLRFPAYIRRLSAPPPLPQEPWASFSSSTPSLAATKGSIGDFGSSPPNPFGF